MKPRLLIISGWAHGRAAMEPMAARFAPHYDVQVRTGAELLTADALPDAECIVTGSMGGLLAMERLPACCKKLVLTSSTARFCATSDYLCGTPERILKRMILQFGRDPQAVLDAFMSNVHHPDPVFRVDPECSDVTLAAGLGYLLKADVREQVASIPIPVLLQHGRLDRIIPVAASDWLHAHLPCSRLSIYEQGGHALPAHQFDEVMCEIEDFLSDSDEA